MNKSKAVTIVPVRSAGFGKNGFTLLELLAVLAIIAVLASLLSTALNHTKAKTFQVGCLNNLRQLQVNWFLYADENDDQLPLNRSESASGLNELIFGRRNSSNSWVVGNPKEDMTTANIVKGSLFPLTRSVSVYRCPSDRSMVIGKPIVRTRSYAMSAFMNGDDAGFDSRVKTSYPAIANPGPDKVFVFIEEHEASIWAGAFNVTPKDKFSLASGSWTSTPSDRHNQGCNLSFADGHVERWKWFWPKSVNLNNKLSVNQHELRDLRRLQEAVPQR